MTVSGNHEFNCRGGTPWPPEFGNKLISGDGRPRRAAPTIYSLVRIGLTFTQVQVKGFNSSNGTCSETFRVNVSLFDSIAPAVELEKVGIEPQGRGTYELATGEVLEYEYAFVELRFLDEITATRIFFGPDDVEPCLGRLALNAAGFLVDLKSQK